MTLPLKHWYLRTQSLFSQLNQQEINELNVISCFRTFKKGEYIYFNHDDMDRLYFVKKGRIKLVSQNDDGEEVLVEILKEEDVFGAISLQTTTNQYQEYAQALSNVHLCSFFVKDFETMLQKKPSLAINYMKKVGSKFYSIQNKFTDLVFRDSKNRILNFFRYNALHEGKQQADGSILIEMLLSHQDIANFTAVSRQTTTKIINELVVAQKIIYLNRRTVLIPNIENL